jgi:hypothetical protein
MRPEEIHEFVRQTPFRPIRLTLIDGRTYDVVHPELAMAGKQSMVVGLPCPGNSGAIYDRTVTISLLHVMQVEEIEQASASSEN